MTSNSYRERAEVFATDKARYVKEYLTQTIDETIQSLSQKSYFRNYLVYNKKTNSAESAYPKMKSPSPLSREFKSSEAPDIMEQIVKHKSTILNFDLSLKNIQKQTTSEQEFIDTDQDTQIPILATVTEELLFLNSGINPNSQTLKRAMSFESIDNSNKYNRKELKTFMKTLRTRQKIAQLNVNIGKIKNVRGKFKSFFVLSVCDSTFVSPTIFVNSENNLVWEFNMSFDIDNIFDDLRLVVYNSGLISDSILGQVMIPLKYFLPNIGEPFDKRTLQGDFELYPLLDAESKFKAAFKNLKSSGLRRPRHRIGIAEIRCELCYNRHISIFDVYLKPNMPLIKRNLSSENITFSSNIPGDIAEKYYKILRHVERLKIIGVRISTPIFDSVNFIRKNYIIFSGFFIAVLTSSFLYVGFKPLTEVTVVESLHFSLVLSYWVILFGVLLYSYSSFKTREAIKPKPLIWSDETTDEDSHLTQLQRLLKISNIVTRAEQTLSFWVDNVEKIGNLFNFEDSRVTLVSIFSFCTFWIFLRIFVYYANLAIIFTLLLCIYGLTYMSNFKNVSLRFVSVCKSFWLQVPTVDEINHQRICLSQIKKK